jgi:aspartyl-tRNA(Asn)/glutamyl-tRNA(Gln) amidotransferase subunit C
MVDKKEIERIANLARLKLKEEEIEGFSKDLSSVIDYIDMLNEVDVKGVEPLSHVHDIKNVMREDIRANQSQEVIDKLIEAAPDKESDSIKVKSILN